MNVMAFASAADELRTTPVREFAQARIQEIYNTISSTIPQTHADAPEHSQIHSSATRHLVHRFIGIFSSLAKMTLNKGISHDISSDENLAELYCKCRCVRDELRTKRDGRPVAAAERDLINKKMADVLVAKNINIVFEQIEEEAKDLATWAEHHRQKSSDNFKRIRDSSITEIDVTRPAVALQQEPSATKKRLMSSYAIADHVRKAKRFNEL